MFQFFEALSLRTNVFRASLGSRKGAGTLPAPLASPEQWSHLHVSHPPAATPSADEENHQTRDLGPVLRPPGTGTTAHAGRMRKSRLAGGGGARGGASCWPRGLGQGRSGLQTLPRNHSRGSRRRATWPSGIPAIPRTFPRFSCLKPPWRLGHHVVPLFADGAGLDHGQNLGSGICQYLGFLEETINRAC